MKALNNGGPLLARVSLGLGLSLENGPRGKTLGVGEEPARHAYRWPPVSRFLERDLSVAYAAVTGRRVFRGPHRLLILAARLHGPDTIPLLRELYREGGVQDLLARLIAYPPRVAPHPDYDISKDGPSEDQRVRPADPPPSASVRVVPEPRVDQASRGAPPRLIEARERISRGLMPIAPMVSRWADDEIVPGLSGQSRPITTRDQDDRLSASASGLGVRPPHGMESSPTQPPQVRRPRPPDCPYPSHELTWVLRPDGTWRCGTCHP